MEPDKLEGIPMIRSTLTRRAERRAAERERRARESARQAKRWAVGVDGAPLALVTAR